jgi:hypothetical protein
MVARMHLNVTFYYIARLGRMDLYRRRHHANIAVSAAEYMTMLKETQHKFDLCGY